ncbi:MAG: hypothetical protein WCG75_11445 [Armatimonadota bacterium]
MKIPRVTKPRNQTDDIEEAIYTFMAQHAVTILRYAMATVFIWFGALKLLPGLSPAEAIAGRTLSAMTLGLLQPKFSLPLLAVFEMTIGFGFAFARNMRPTILMLMMHMAGTLTPFLFFPHETMSSFGVPTMTGQYILKNMVFIAVGFVMIGTLKRNNPVES